MRGEETIHVDDGEVRRQWPELIISTNLRKTSQTSVKRRVTILRCAAAPERERENLEDPFDDGAAGGVVGRVGGEPGRIVLLLSLRVAVYEDGEGAGEGVGVRLGVEVEATGRGGGG